MIIIKWNIITLTVVNALILINVTKTISVIEIIN